MSSRAAPTTVAVATAVDRIGPNWDQLFAAGPGLQSGRAWCAASTAAALPPGVTPNFVCVRDADGPLALVPMAAGPGRRWASLTTPYTCLFQPLIRPGTGPALVSAAGAALGRLSRAWPITLLEALDPDWPDLPPFRAGLGSAGLAIRSFVHFANWHGRIPAGGWPEYLRGRPGELRETIRRKTRLVEREPGMRFEIVRDPAALGAALTAYEVVYARSWKEQEPYAAFNATLVEALAPSGALRIGLLWAGERPIAAQYWTVVGRVATVLKLAHDDEFRSVSPGTVLTAFAIRTMIEQDAIEALDFGRGDDAYKRGWTGERRPRIGLAAFNPATFPGLIALARHHAGEFLRAGNRKTLPAGQSS
ncbi:MAG: hypothetical protein NVSMB18_01170 [Acetobacteraceae bacterium]